YRLAVSAQFQAKRIMRVHGVGVDTDRYQAISQAEKLERRASFRYSPDDYLMIYAAEFNRNKNQSPLIKAMAELKAKIPHAKLLLAGEGPWLDHCRRLAEQLHVSSHVHFLGYRNDMDQLLPICDVAVASSRREGLPVNMLEAMACGLPVVAASN